MANLILLIHGKPYEAYIDNIILFLGTIHAEELFNPNSEMFFSVCSIYLFWELISEILKKGILPL